MNLEELLALIAFTKKNHSTLNTHPKYHLVVMLRSRQFQLNEISRYNIELFKYASIFATGQPIQKLQKRLARQNILEKTIEQMKKRIESQQKKEVPPLQSPLFVY
jgi:hypothetical protein